VYIAWFSWFRFRSSLFPPSRIRSCAAAKRCQIADERLGVEGPSARVIVKDFAGKRTGFAPVKPLQAQKYPGGARTQTQTQTQTQTPKRGRNKRSSTADGPYHRRCVEMFLSARLRVIIDFSVVFPLRGGGCQTLPPLPTPLTALSCFKFPMIWQLFSGRQLRACLIIDKKPNIGQNENSILP